MIELLEALDIPEAQIEELAANMELVKTLDRPEDLMIHLSAIAARIIKNTGFASIRVPGAGPSPGGQVFDGEFQQENPPQTKRSIDHQQENT